MTVYTSRKGVRSSAGKRGGCRVSRRLKRDCYSSRGGCEGQKEMRTKWRRFYKKKGGGPELRRAPKKKRTGELDLSTWSLKPMHSREEVNHAGAKDS